MRLFNLESGTVIPNCVAFLQEGAKMIDGKIVIFRLAAKICLEDDGHYGSIYDNIKKTSKFADVYLSDCEIRDMVDKYMPTKGQLESARLIEKNLGIKCEKVDRYHVGTFIEKFKEQSIYVERKRRDGRINVDSKDCENNRREPMFEEQ